MSKNKGGREVRKPKAAKKPKSGELNTIATTVGAKKPK